MTSKTLNTLILKNSMKGRYNNTINFYSKTMDNLTFTYYENGKVFQIFDNNLEMTIYSSK